MSAFTLVELLVVVAIIGILAALLLSGISAAKDRAIRAKCLSNVRQLTMASLSYAFDNRDRLPQSVNSTSPLELNGSAVVNFIKAHRLTRDALYDPGNPAMNHDGYWDNWSPTPPSSVIGYAVTFPGGITLKPENVNTLSVPQQPAIGTVLLPAPRISERVLIAGMVVSELGQTNTNDVRFTYNYGNIFTPMPGGVDVHFDGTSDVHPPDLNLYARSSHLKGRLPSGDNLGFLDGSARWRKFKPMIPRTSANAVITFWW